MNNKIAYKIRGSYPNYFMLKLFVDKGAREFEKDREPEGNKPGTIIYRWPKDTAEAAEIAPRWYDVYYMLRHRGAEAEEFLKLLILEERGDAEAQVRLKDIRRRFYEQCRTYVSDHPLIDTEFVTSALSPKTHNVYEISHKGVMLTDLTRTGYAVPDFSLLSSKVFEQAARYANAAPAQQAEEEERQRTYLRQAVRNLEIMTGCRLGASAAPLVMALRSTMPQYIPGLMPTLLNVGTNRTAYKGLLRDHGAQMATRIYWNNLMGLYKMLFNEPNPFEAEAQAEEIARHSRPSDKQERQAALERRQKWIAETERLIERHPQGKRYLDDAFEQLYAYQRHIRAFYQNNQDLLMTFMQGKTAYPSLILQKMVWTIGSESSYPGVLYSRHSRTGLGVQIESYPDIFGEEIMTGNLSPQDCEYFDRAQIKETFPAVYHFDPLLPKLEKRLGSPVTIEFGTESRQGKADLFAVLQINESELTGRAALLSSVALYEAGLIGKRRVGELVRPYHRRQIFSERIDDSSLQTLIYFARGVNVLPRSAVSAKLCFNTAVALELKRKGEKICLCKERFLPEDTIVLSEMDAIASMTPAAIHVVTACRGYGIPAFLNLQKYGVRLEDKSLVNENGLRISEGDDITLSSKNATIYKGHAQFKPARFLDYLNGKQLDMTPKEEAVFVRMKEAYQKYTDIVTSIEVPDIVDLNNLVRLIRTDMSEHPETARAFVNDWFDSNVDQYVSQLMESSMGSHQDQYRVYEFLSTDRKITFFRHANAFCLERKRSGLDAGSFMLGRFLATPQPMVFWQQFSGRDLAFMLNEYVLYEKYLNVLYEVGEQQITKARRQILSENISNIETKIYNVDQFVSLKLTRPDWQPVEDAMWNLHNVQPESTLLLKKLKQPFGQLFNYAQPWSLAKLEDVCRHEGCEVPGEGAV